MLCGLNILKSASVVYNFCWWKCLQSVDSAPMFRYCLWLFCYDWLVCTWMLVIVGRMSHAYHVILAVRRNSRRLCAWEIERGVSPSQARRYVNIAKSNSITLFLTPLPGNSSHGTILLSLLTLTRVELLRPWMMRTSRTTVQRRIDNIAPSSWRQEHVGLERDVPVIILTSRVVARS